MDSDRILNSNYKKKFFKKLYFIFFLNDDKYIF